MSEPAINVKLTVENGQFKARLGESTETFKKFSTETKHEAASLESQLDSLVKNMDGVNNALIEIKNVGEAFVAFEAIHSIVDGMIHIRAEYEKLQIAMSGAMGSEEGGLKQLAWVDEMSDKVGGSLDRTRQAYIRFLAAADAGKVPLGDTQRLFKSISEAGVVLGRDAGQLARVFMTLQQMMASGTVNVAQLKLVIGRTLPGVYERFVEEGRTMSKTFDEDMKRGILSTREWMGALATAARKPYTDEQVARVAHNLEENIDNVKEAFDRLKLAFSAGKFGESMKEELEGVASVVDRLGKAVKWMSEGWGASVVVTGIQAVTFITLAQGTAKLTAMMVGLVKTILIRNGLMAASVPVTEAAAVATKGLAGALTVSVPPTVATTVATGALATSMTVATVAARALWAAIGGWAGVILAVAYGAYKLITLSDEQTEANKKESASLEELTKAEGGHLVAMAKTEAARNKKRWVEAEETRKRAAVLRAELKATSDSEFLAKGYGPTVDVEKYKTTAREIAELTRRYEELRDTAIATDTVLFSRREEVGSAEREELADKRIAQAYTHLDRVNKETADLQRKIKPATAKTELAALKKQRDEDLATFNAEYMVKIAGVKGGERTKLETDFANALKNTNEAYRVLFQSRGQLAAQERAAIAKRDKAALERDFQSALKGTDAELERLANRQEIYALEVSGASKEEIALEKILIGLRREHQKAYEKLDEAVTNSVEEHEAKVARQVALEKQTQATMDEERRKGAIAIDEGKKERARSLHDYMKKLDEDTRLSDSWYTDPKVKEARDREEERLARMIAFEREAKTQNWKPGSDRYVAEQARTLEYLDALDAKTADSKDKMKKFGVEAASGLESSLGAALYDMTTNAKSMGDAFSELGTSFYKMILKMVADMASTNIMDAFKLLARVAMGASYSEGASFANPNGLLSVSPSEWATAPSGLLRGSSSSLSARDVSSNLSGGAGQTVNVINNTGQEATATPGKGPDGQDLINVIIGRIAKDIHQNGPVGQAVQRSFGVTRKGVTR